MVDTSESSHELQPSYVLHPITNDVYEIPAGSLLHDLNNPVYMEFDSFEQMASTGQLSGERLLHDRAFNASQVLAVRLKRHGASAGGPPLFAWATRMVTALPEEVFPRLIEALVGHQFVWIWPLGKAHNAFHSRKERLRNGATQQATLIDEIEPTCFYTPYVAGAMMGPEDIEGAVRVPFEHLSPINKFFVMCINPQKTLFPRRSTADRWTQRVTEIIDENQRAARQGGKWALHNSVQRLLHTSKKRNHNECLDVDAVMEHKEKWHLEVRAEERAHLWSKLPTELTALIFCARLSDALTSASVEEACASVLALRAVSRGVLALVDSYIGVQLSNVSDDALACILPLSAMVEARSHVEVASRARALGLNMTGVARLTMHELQLERVPGWSLPKMPNVVPDWRWYFELRRETRQCQGFRTCARKKPSSTISELMRTHRKEEPHVWASRFPCSGFALDFAVNDAQQDMHAIAGVGG